MDSLLLLLILDALSLLIVAVILWPRLSFWHPLIVYYVFHLFSFTLRGWNIYNGAPTMYANQANAEAVTLDEITRALGWADVGLILFGLGALWAHRRGDREATQPAQRAVLSRRMVAWVCFFCLPVGLFFFFTAKSGGLDLSLDNAASNYFQVFAMWPIGCLGLLIFTYGFRWYWLILLAAVLAPVALQGYHRFMLVLPLLFFTAYYLLARRRRWPTFPILIAAFFLAAVFPRLKYIGRAVQLGDTGDALALVKESFISSKNGEGGEAGEDFLDQYAGALTMIDYNGKKFNGSTYIAIITLPIPRAWWSGKPGLADHLVDISTATRQYNLEGRILTYLGEAYLNFGYAGLIIVPFLLGYCLTLFCVRATTGVISRLSCYLYLVFFSILVQVFRDGMVSLVVFTIVHNMPMMFVWILHKIPGVGQKVFDPPLAAGGPGRIS